MGYTKTTEHRAALADAARRKWTDPEYRARMLPVMRRGPMSAEARANMARSQRGKTIPPEVREKMAAAQRGRVARPESIAKCKATKAARDPRSPAEKKVDRGRRIYAHKLWKLYRIREHDVALLVDAQGGLCPCGADIRSLTGWQVHIDHCHETGRVRGLLCTACNWNLGQVERIASSWGWDRLRQYLR